MSKTLHTMVRTMVLATATLAAGCAAESVGTFTPAPNAPALGPARAPGQVAVVDKVDRPYVVLGHMDISPDSNRTQQQWFGVGKVALMEQYYGAKLGCDAVLADDVIGIGGLWEARASCVRFTNQ